MSVATYQKIYERQTEGDPQWQGYGKSNHGRPMVPWMLNYVAHRLLQSGSLFVIDAGCGHNDFAKMLRHGGTPAIGIDCACPGADLRLSIEGLHTIADSYEDCRVWETPGLPRYLPAYPDRVLTAFDVLEHIEKEDLPAAFNAMRAAAPTCILSIGYGPSIMTLDGENLHPTAETREWWLETLSDHGLALVELPAGYIIGRWT